MGGNIGKPLLPDADGMEHGDIAVLELSSFQLMTMRRSPDVAVITNLAPNHLDVHASMEEYVSAKENLYLHQEAEGLVVLNEDNAITRGFAAKAPGRVTRFSRKRELGAGAFSRRRTGPSGSPTSAAAREALPIGGILLPGVHNVENYMAAIGAVSGLVPDEVTREFAAAFKGVEHRIELVRTLRGVRY